VFFDISFYEPLYEDVCLFFGLCSFECIVIAVSVLVRDVEQGIVVLV